MTQQSTPTPIPTIVWILALTALVLAFASCGLWALYLLRSQQVGNVPYPTPIIWTATPTPTILPSPSPTWTPEPTPTASPEIAIGRYVRVSGTGGAGVSLRQEPDTGSPRLSIGQEGEIFIVVSGPRVGGGYTWWLIRDPTNEMRQGWAVANYLQPVDRP
ncbi:MAG: SH3 domain-containing protein [Anaerolineae bacterium]|nr:SH3 domain-containing protein [Anaerolineae bacterium]